MAKIIENATSGSVGSTTHSHNRAGQYVRNRTMPTQPVGTGRRGVIKAAFAASSSAWSSLSGTVQAAWNSYANMHPYTDSLGQSIKLTGHQMYVAINTQLINCGLVQSAAIPVSDSVFAAVLTSFTAVHAGAITLTPGGGGAATDFLLVAFSKPQSGGVTFNKTFWQYSHVAGNSVTAIVATTGYNAQFGSPSVNQRIFYKLTPVNQYGVTGTPNSGYITVS